MFDTYVLDVRGRGLSESSSTLDYGLNACAADVAGFAAALKFDSFSLVGHSMGGHLCLRAVAERQVRPDALILSAPMLAVSPEYQP